MDFGRGDFDGTQPPRKHYKVNYSGDNVSKSQHLQKKYHYIHSDRNNKHGVPPENKSFNRIKSIRGNHRKEEIPSEVKFLNEIHSSRGNCGTNEIPSEVKFFKALNISSQLCREDANVRNKPQDIQAQKTKSKSDYKKDGRKAQYHAYIEPQLNACKGWSVKLLIAHYETLAEICKPDATPVQEELTFRLTNPSADKHTTHELLRKSHIPHNEAKYTAPSLGNGDLKIIPRGTIEKLDDGDDIQISIDSVDLVDSGNGSYVVGEVVIVVYKVSPSGKVTKLHKSRHKVNGDTLNIHIDVEL